jgi:DeoR family transcriptional regulator of aga operon
MQHSLVDPMGGLMLERINARTVFLGCNGIDPNGGITNINLPEAEIKRRMLQAARQRVIVADGSKVGRVELAYLCGVDEIDLLITDSSADPAVLNALREKELHIMLAK